MDRCVAEDKQIVFRVGVNLGEVVVEGEDIYGDGVNVAARLEALCEPGGVWLSDNVHRQVRGKMDLLFEDVGEQSLKNIAEPQTTELMLASFRLIVEIGDSWSLDSTAPISSCTASMCADFM